VAISHTNNSHAPYKLPAATHSYFMLPLLAIAFGALSAATGQVALVGFPNYWLADASPVVNYHPQQIVKIYDRFNHLASTAAVKEDRLVVPLDKVSKSMQNAILAAEDRNFYQHHGVDPVGIVRALVADLQAGKVVQGGSTITQQLVKNLYFAGHARTPWIKFQECMIAWQLELQCSKKKLLECYLNQIYFGRGVYGIERAAQRYFGVHASALTIPQSAFLASLVRSPSHTGSPRYLKEALARQHQVLRQMSGYGFISSAQSLQAQREPLQFKDSTGTQTYPYYTAYIMDLLKQSYAKPDIFKDGLSVYTSLDPAAQRSAEKTINTTLKNTPQGVHQAALVSLSVRDGSIIALVGGAGPYWNHQFNRATNQHTMGSAFKPFVYLSGLIKGTLQPDTILEDEPLVIKQPGLPDYVPKNFDNEFMGPLSVRRAFYLSRNICAVRTAQLTGFDKAAEVATAAGITSELKAVPSIAVGSSAATPLDMAVAYGTLARSGAYISPTAIRRIDNNQGKTIATFQSKSYQAFAVEPVHQLVDIMTDVVTKGTGTQARLPNRPVAGKTGTADQFRDIWFVGFTPDLVTAVWAGNDDHSPISGRVTGGGLPAKMWRQYNMSYYAARPTPTGFFIPPVNPILDASPGLLASVENWLFGNSDDNNQPQKDTKQSTGKGIFHRLIGGVVKLFD
jgi:penicillin-binding protein 1A